MAHMTVDWLSSMVRIYTETKYRYFGEIFVTVPEVIKKTTTCGTASKGFFIMTTFPFQCRDKAHSSQPYD